MISLNFVRIINMQITVENVSKVERRLTIVVPVNQVETLYEQKIGHLAKKVAIKGYRPGKVPKATIEQRYGEDARREALSEVMGRTLLEAMEEKKLHPVSTPQIEPKPLIPNQPLEFTAEFEVLPDIEKVNVSLTGIEKLAVEVTEEDVGRVVEQLQKQYTKWTLVDRPAQWKDRLVINFSADYEGKPDTESKTQNFPLELGSQTMLPHFEEGLLGVKVGDEKTLKLTFPADFERAESAGKPVEFAVEVKQVL